MSEHETSDPVPSRPVDPAAPSASGASTGEAEASPSSSGERVDAHRETLAAARARALPKAPSVPPRGGFQAWIGRTIDDRYRIEAMLGEGGMGAVFLAEHLKLQKKVALKVILPRFAGVGEVAQRFAREAMATAQLDHPHIASAIDYGVLPREAGSDLSEGGAYLVMQYVRGRSLRAVMAERAGDWAFAAEVGAQIADALAAAHGARIVHRDLKPENVMLEARDEAPGQVHVRVLDFGVARMVGDEESEGGMERKLTRVGTILGTPGYMAPEQALGEAVDERADLYALGILLWECVAGRDLFTGADVPEILTSQLTGAVPPLRAIAPAIPFELEVIVMGLLAPRRDDRPSKASEVRDALRKLVLERELARVSASGVGASELAARLSSVVTDEAAWRGPTAPPAQHTHGVRLGSIVVPRSVALGALGVSAALVLVVGIALGSMLGGSSPTPAPGAPSGASPPGSTRPSLAAHDPPSAPSSVPPHAAPAPPRPTTPPIVGARDPGAVALDPSAPTAVITPEIARDLGILLASESRETRRTAADGLLARAEPLPPLVDALARLEVAEGCNAKKAALRTLRELRDPAALPAVERLARLPRRGCGLFGRSDCWACLRPDTRRTIESLRGEQGAAPQPEAP